MTGAPIPPQIAAIERPAPALFTWYIVKAISTGPALLITMPLLYFRYHTMRYRIDAEGIHMTWGILLRREIMLNYSRIQDIQLRSNVVERWLGLARIEIQTASGSAGSEMVLEGLLNSVEVRDFLYSRMRGAHPEPARGAHAAGESLADLLGDIASELRGIRTSLDAHRDDRSLEH